MGCACSKVVFVSSSFRCLSRNHLRGHGMLGIRQLHHVSERSVCTYLTQQHLSDGCDVMCASKGLKLLEPWILLVARTLLGGGHRY